jgi:hypothetical protein
MCDHPDRFSFVQWIGSPSTLAVIRERNVGARRSKAANLPLQRRVLLGQCAHSQLSHSHLSDCAPLRLTVITGGVIQLMTPHVTLGRGRIRSGDFSITSVRIYSDCHRDLNDLNDGDCRSLVRSTTPIFDGSSEGAVQF